jgi:hypothetical protein
MRFVAGTASRTFGSLGVAGLDLAFAARHRRPEPIRAPATAAGQQERFLLVIKITVAVRPRIGQLVL